MSIEAMKQALEALENSKPSDAGGWLDAEAMNDLWHAHYAAINALRTAIKQAESEPLTDTFVQTVPDKCDRILWRGRYLHLSIPNPAPGVPAGQAPSVWNSIQIASWIGSQLMREPSMFERNAVCKFVRSLGRHPTLLKHSPKDTHPAPGVPDDVVRDAERYRWLRRKACVIGKTTYCGEETGQPILDFVNLPDVTEVIRRDSATTLDAAIDAAMQKGGDR